MKFGENLRLLMEENNITPKQLAKTLRVSITMLHNYTRCLLEPDFDTLKRMADYFHVSTDTLLGYECQD